MKATGVTRKIDELGRIVIPKEIRRNLGIRDGETLEIFTDNEGIFLKKHLVLENLTQTSQKLCEIIGSLLDIEILITDREKIIASAKNDLKGELLPIKLLNMIDERESFNGQTELVFKTLTINNYVNIIPIIASIDSLGLIIISSPKNIDYSVVAKLIAQILVNKVDI